MFDWLVDIIKAIWDAIFGGGGGSAKAINVTGKKLCMPLFVPLINGAVNGTWNYLSLSAAERKNCRNNIKAMAKSGEVPALTCLLSPSECAANLWASFPTINLSALANIKAICLETVKDGVALGVTLYCDDPGDKDPKWFEITNANHQVAWTQVWNEIKEYISFVTLSIETNERATGVGMMQHCIHLMELAMPGAQVYGTHMTINGAGLSGYRWNTASATPFNAGIILVENSWTISNQDQGMGDRQGVAGAAKDWNLLTAMVSPSKVVMHEGNLRPNSVTCEAQRNFYRSKGAWGVGS